MGAERPILFSAPMVRAILAGRKTQTRRVLVKRGGFSAPDHVEHTGMAVLDDGRVSAAFRTPWKRVVEAMGWGRDPTGWDYEYTWEVCPYGSPGDRMWVRETWGQLDSAHPDSEGVYEPDVWTGKPRPGLPVVYRADYAGHEEDGAPWRPSIFLPRWASRLTLDVTAVRIERLQSISEADARAEGCTSDMDWISKIEGVRGAAASRVLPTRLVTARENYRWLWDEINGKRAPWATNPWVWVVSFRVLEVRRG